MKIAAKPVKPLHASTFPPSIGHADNAKEDPMTTMFHPLRSLKTAVSQIGSAIDASEAYSNAASGRSRRTARGENALVRHIPL